MIGDEDLRTKLRSILCTLPTCTAHDAVLERLLTLIRELECNAWERGMRAKYVELEGTKQSKNE